MSDGQQQIVTLTTYQIEPANVTISVPAHLSLRETRERIRAAIREHAKEHAIEADLDLSSIIIVPCEILLSSSKYSFPDDQQPLRQTLQKSMYFDPTTPNVTGQADIPSQSISK